MGGKVLQLESERLFELGEARGKIIGKAEGKAEIARAMLAKGMDMEVISELTGISIGELKDL